MQEQAVTFSISGDEALIMFEALSSYYENASDGCQQTPEYRVASRLIAILEKQLVTPFDPAYRDHLNTARQRVLLRDIQ
ncbi:hypothetical protein Q1W73_04670 [Asticcacaulis sp. ZE23SCel15]|uniref:hypothetical protein n=1 Tax=Asticcacaulis sp. ZE23SCel15 TaxID=3059027 RepID=UPI00265FF26F|nr:hypothetical protein [Asticcacaulis sp. ZE23SCel15]WKL58280.1 hypothetical protein Q1W73_04670 [Asticcacaulis sp. ZE23SCel15]